MADNTTLDPGAGGDTIATDDVGGVKYQRVKLDGGGDGAAAPILGDSSNGLDVDVTRSALPSGASTAAKQPALGTAGSASSDVITVQGVASMTPLLVNGSGVTQPVSGTVTANLAAGTNNIGDVDVLTVPADPFGANADAAATAGSTGSIQAKLRLMTSQLDAIKTSVETLDNAIAGSEMQVDVLTMPSTAVTNAGTFVTQENGAALTALQLIDNTIFVDDAAFTVATSSVSAIGLLADQSSTDSVNEGDIGIPRMTLTRQQISTIAPSADTEGLTIFRTLDADVTEEEIKATAGKLYGWYLYNDGAAEAYVKFYNATAANVTVGTTTPILTIPVPAGSAANVEFTNGITFSTALCIAATTVVTDADTTDTSANQVVANVFYA